MTATKHSFTSEQGATFLQVITWRNDGDEFVNNTGYTARMQVRRTPATAVLASLTTENDKIELGGANGEIEIRLSPEETANLEPGDYLYDLEMEDSNGDVTRLIEGVFSVQAEITK